MAVNQAQVDHIITAASEDDPEVKLQNLEREVDLIKTSIKRLLMDIRERMNEMENPFTIAAGSGTTGESEGAADSMNAAKRAALDAKEAALEARESTLDAAKARQDADVRETIVKKPESEVRPVTAPLPVIEERRLPDEQMISLMKTQILNNGNKGSPNALANEKLRLQKVYKLFKWTNAVI